MYTEHSLDDSRPILCVYDSVSIKNWKEILYLKFLSLIIFKLYHEDKIVL